MLLPLLLLLSATNVLSQSSNCGQMPDEGTGNNRIINGRKAINHIPWMVKLVVNHAACGGALLSPTHVITAAHCFCDLLVECPKAQVGSEKSVPVDQIQAYAGSLHGKDGGVKLTVQSVMLHVGYQSEADPKEHDLAMIQLANPGANMDGTTMASLCLPPSGGEEVKDMGAKVVTAGWGHERTATTCLTNQNGPALFSECSSLPCDRQHPPPTSAYCSQFLAKVKRRNDLDLYKLMPSGENCYATDKAKDGWCYTTQNKAANEWGFCMETCSAEELKITTTLNMIELEVYNQSTCHEGMINPEIELCVGGRPNKPRIGVYKDDGNGNFQLDSTEGGEPFDFFGYKDTCQGDSGGPIWTDHQGRATLVAVVSRGGDCAAKDMPGVGTRIKAHIPWITEKMGMAGGGEQQQQQPQQRRQQQHRRQQQQQQQRRQQQQPAAGQFMRRQESVGWKAGNKDLKARAGASKEESSTYLLLPGAIEYEEEEEDCQNDTITELHPK